MKARENSASTPAWRAPAGKDEHARGDGQRQDDRGGRDDAAQPLPVDPSERHCSGVLGGFQQIGSDEEAGDDEEDVDADESACRPPPQRW